MLRRAVRAMSTVKFPQQAASQDAAKPKLSQFKNPLYHTFLLASATYIFLHTVWFSLEYEEEKRRLEDQSNVLEKRIHDLVDAKRAELESKKNSWWPRFWK